ncbi:MAG: DHH family phosphoesterase [Thermodesulfovibrionia bacterium]|nr:DHH family phosphoesterase [Thermodesulfovibrionia bacterium]
MEIITTHINADFDAVASMVAAKKYYPGAVLVFSGSQEKSVREFLASSQLELDVKSFKEVALDDVERLVIVDINSSKRIGGFSEIFGRKGLDVHVYDHHPSSLNGIKGHKMVIQNVGATITIFAEMLMKDKVKLSPAEATLMMLGIYEETGSLVFPGTTVRDMNAAAYLLQNGANLNIVSRFMSRKLGPEEIDLLNELMHSANDYVIHEARIKIAKASRDDYIGDIAYLAHKVMDVKDIDAIFLIVMMGERVNIIARSNVAEVNVSEMLEPFGGGGHHAAASAVAGNISLEDAEERLLKVLNDKVHPTKTASDIMTSPVKSISWKSSIAVAEKSMTRFSVNVLPILKGTAFFGTISREAVEKALFHGFGDSLVSEFCTTDTQTVSPSTPLNMVEQLMIEQNQRFMPVLEGQKVIGAITRTDLLRSIYESLLRKGRLETGEPLRDKPSIGRNLASIMRSKFPEEVFKLLVLAGEVAEQSGFSAYLVGGSVRDLKRGESNLDIDIVVEGDGIEFARDLGKRLKAKVKAHQRFGTAVIVTDFLKFDVATARTEYYESPAALPQVEISSIKKDLYRRDFTINTLAVLLNPGKFGQLLDFFGGQRDIKEKTIRILHNLSFIEDPTRAFRAIRFSERFGFNISKHTMNLIRTAVRINLFDKLSGARLYDELNLLFHETEPARAIKRLSEFDLLRFIHPSIKLTNGLLKKIEALHEVYVWFNLLYIEENINITHLFLIALLEVLDAEERESALQRLKMPASVRKEIIESIYKSDNALKGLRKASAKEIYHILSPLTISAILFAMAKAKGNEEKKAISLFLVKIRSTRTELAGKDLKLMGYKTGPLFKKIFKAIIDARLEGLVKSRQDEVKFVKKQFPVKGNFLE